MRVVFLYGPPGVGKLTIGAELATLTGFRLVHNHLALDLATAVFPRLSPPWVRLVRQLQRAVLEESVREEINLICTGVLHPEHADAVRAMLEPVRDGGGSVTFVQLVCDLEELRRRVQGESRRAHRKLTDPAGLRDPVSLFATMPFEPHLRLDTTGLDAAQAAGRVAAHLSLPVQREATRPSANGPATRQ